MLLAPTPGEVESLLQKGLGIVGFSVGVGLEGFVT